MTKLSNTQTIILSSAAQRADGNLLSLPGSLRSGATGKVVGALLVRGLIREQVTDNPREADAALNTVWRNEDRLRCRLQRLVLAEFFEGDHREQVGACPATRHGMERRARLGDLLASPAGELLADRLDNLPAARHDLQGFGNVFAIFTMREEPQQVHVVGASTTTRSRGKCSGKGFFTGRRGSKAATFVAFSAART